MSNTQLDRYSRHVYFNEQDQDYVALCSEFRHLSAFGDSPEEALQALDEALEAAIEIYAEEGWPIPRPEAPPEPEGLPSGRFVTRIPKTLHAQLVRQAQHEGVSQNQLVLAYIAKGLGAAVREATDTVGFAGQADWVQHLTPMYRRSPRVAVFRIQAPEAPQAGSVGFGRHRGTQDTSMLALVSA